MEYIIYFLIACIFLKIAYTDYKEHAIYDRDIWISALLVGIYQYLCFNLWDSILFAVIGLLIGFAIFLAAYYFYGFEAFGLGDVLLFGVLGLLFSSHFLNYLGLTLMISGFIIMFFIPFMGYEKVSKLEIPLAPLLLAWVPVFILIGKPSIIVILQRFV